MNRSHHAIGLGKLFLSMAIASLVGLPAFVANGQNITEIAPNFADPLNLRGVSGGPNKSNDCGFIANQPNHVIRVTGAIPYLKFQVNTTGSPTLLVEGPAGRFCVLPNSPNSGNIELSGHGAQGIYNIYVGDRTQGQHSYSLSLTQKRN